MPPRTRGNVRPHGQIRQSQIVTTFGPGAMVDLPDHAVIIGGLDHWTCYEDHPIVEERLAAKVGTLLGRDQVKFYAPPHDNDDPSAPVTGITAWLFPEWFVAQHELQEGGIARGRSSTAPISNATARTGATGRSRRGSSRSGSCRPASGAT